MIKHKIFITLLFLITLYQTINGQQLMERLINKFGIDYVTRKDSSAFNEYYEIKFRQPINHADTSKGFFLQIVLLGHNNPESAMIIETNGYQILPYQNIKYISEPAKLLNGNQLIVEHRYYGSSIPDTSYQYLNFKQITSDYHNIKNALSDIYKQAWISTGASKGGTTALNYSYYYPEDTDASVIYVAPVVIGLEDKRLTSFLKNKRSTLTGQKLFTIQKQLLQRKKVLIPVFMDIIKMSGLEIGTMDPEILYDFAVLEFDFNFWQYVADFSALKQYNKTTLSDLTKKGLKNTSLLQSESDSMVAAFPMCIWYFLDKPLAKPFFYQSFTETGTYGYEEKLFPHLKLNNYSPAFLTVGNTKYNWEYINSFNVFLKKGLKNTILIYGADDPWTSCKANISASGNNFLIVNRGTNHSTLIKDLAEAEQKKIKDNLIQWTSGESIVK